MPRGKARDLLCLLLIHRGAVVPVDAVIDALWEDAPTANARNAVHVVVSRLRAALGAELVFSAGGGYGVRISADGLDADRFEALCVRGRRELERDQLGEAAATLRAALSLWRGPALADVGRRAFAQLEIARLESLRLAATIDRIAAEVAAGEAGDHVGELQALVAEHPVDERLRELLMLTLYRAGRQAEALATFRDARRALVDGLGLEPGTRLRALETAILRHEVPPPPQPPDGPREDGAARRQVTCLYARLMPRAPGDATDPEVLRAAVGRFHALMRTRCARHGGTVVQIHADGALAVFGIPVAHEDDPLRAVRVALEIRDGAAMLGGGFEAATGLATGVVIAAALPAEAALYGDPITAADALAHHRGEIRLAPSTQALVKHADRGVALADGSFRLDGAIDDEPAISRRLDRPLVGRSRQLDTLRAAFREAQDTSAWDVVIVIGEAGIGKSRLAAELPAALPAGTTVLEGRCPPYGEGTTFRPLREVVLQACAGRTLSQLAADLELDPEIVDRVAATVGLATGPVGDEAPWAFRRFIAALSHPLPVVVVVDDLHWAEPGLLDLLAEVTRPSDARPALLVCLARPELLESRPTG